MKSPRFFEALEDFQQVRDQLDPALFLMAMVASLVAALAAAGLYHVFYERRGTGSQVHRAFPLMAVSVTAMFIAVQLSIPLSLGLLGALSIVRFRTPIKEPEEVGFIMLVIATSISAATFNFFFVSLLMGVAVVALLCVRGARRMAWSGRDGVLVFQVPDGEAGRVLGRLAEGMKKHVRRIAVETSASRDGVTRIHVVFAGLRTDVAGLQDGLRELGAVQSVHVFLDRPGGLR